MTSAVAQSAATPLICARRKRTCENVKGGGVRNGWLRGQGGGGGFLAHLLRLAAAGSAPPRPQKAKSPHLAKPAKRAPAVR